MGRNNELAIDSLWQNFTFSLHSSRRPQLTQQNHQTHIIIPIGKFKYWQL